jgi:hypothetical protein
LLTREKKSLEGATATQEPPVWKVFTNRPCMRVVDVSIVCSERGVALGALSHITAQHAKPITHEVRDSPVGERSEGVGTKRAEAGQAGPVLDQLAVDRLGQAGGHAVGVARVEVDHLDPVVLVGLHDLGVHHVIAP